MGLLLYLASIRVAILTRLWLNTPWPHQTRAPWSPSIWLLFHPKSLLRQLIRPSLPVLHFTNRWNAGFCSMARCDALGLPLVGRTTVLTPMSLRASLTATSPYPRSAVTALGTLPARSATRPMAGANMGASA